MLYSGSLGLGHGMEAYVIGRVEREREEGKGRDLRSMFFWSLLEDVPLLCIINSF